MYEKENLETKEMKLCRKIMKNSLKGRKYDIDSLEIEERENIVMLIRKRNWNSLGKTGISLCSQENSYGENGRKEDSDNSPSAAFNI